MDIMDARIVIRKVSMLGWPPLGMYIFLGRWERVGLVRLMFADLGVGRQKMYFFSCYAWFLIVQ